MPGWRNGLSLSMVWGLLKAREKPTLRVLHSICGPVVSFGHLMHGAFANWTAQCLWRTQWNGLPPGGCLVLDDTVNPKEHTCCTEGAHKCFSGQLKRVVKGQTFLALLYIPPHGAPQLLWLKHWQRGVTNKRDAACQMIEEVLDSGLKPAEVGFDGWYYSPEFCNWLAQRGLTWTTRIQRNRKFSFPDGSFQTPEDWQQDVPVTSWHYYRELYAYIKAVEVTKEGMPGIRLLALRHRRHGKVERYIITNDCSAGVRTIVARYRRRWHIEVMFRYARQKLGFSTYRYLTVEAAERHIALVGLTWNFLSQLSDQTGLSLGRLKRHIEKHARTDVFRHDIWKEAA